MCQVKPEWVKVEPVVMVKRNHHWSKFDILCIHPTSQGYLSDSRSSCDFFGFHSAL